MPAAAKLGQHLTRNRNRYLGGVATTVGGMIAAKPIGKVAGGRGVDRRDPHYDMNYRSGRAQFHKRRAGFNEAGERVLFPVGAAALGAGLIARRGKKGYDEGRYQARQAGAQKGYEDEYRRFYGRRRREDLIEISPVAGALRAIGSRIGSSMGRKRMIGPPMPANIRKQADARMRGSSPRGGGKGLGLKTKLGLGAAGLAAAAGTYKGTSEVYKKVTEQDDPFLEDDLAEVAAPGHILQTARRMGPALKWGSRGLIAADVAMLGHTLRRDRKNRDTPVDKAKRRVKESAHTRIRRVTQAGVPMIDKALVSTSIGGSIYQKTKDYQDRRLLKKVTGGRIDRSKE